MVKQTITKPQFYNWGFVSKVRQAHLMGITIISWVFKELET